MNYLCAKLDAETTDFFRKDLDWLNKYYSHLSLYEKITLLAHWHNIPLLPTIKLT
ncbi:MAG: hypothetical protein R3321_05990 [Nitrososphaeraceae archaeon]|nr:hypothetical protein [Nitrososphaeraceae archaeon]